MKNWAHIKWLTALLALLASTVSADTLRIATGGHYPPYIYNPGTERASGLDKDLMNEICTRGGYDCVWIDLPMGDIFPALARGEVDVVTGGFGYSTNRDKLVDFTCPYVLRADSTGHFIAKNQNIDLINSRIGALDQSLFEEAMEQAERNVYAYPTEVAALNALVAGDVDVVFGSGHMAEVAQSRKGFYDLGGYPTFSGGSVLGVSEDAPYLLVALDKLLADISKDGTLGSLHLRWLGNDLGDVIARCPSLNALT
ncbi:MAG: ABC-type amino acid transport substrate-binding protein [Alteromonas macleodii]|jgi:ABC-type amino acid transport substrate-binding protein